jgi:hypothetical protein
MGRDKKQRVRGTDAGALIGPVWLIGWLFTIGYCGLPFWRAVLALVIWPHFLGAALR